MKKRVSITLDRELYREVKKKAEKHNQPVSRIIEEAIRNWKQDEIREELKEYYTGDTEEKKKIISEGESMIDEVWEEEDSDS